MTRVLAIDPGDVKSAYVLWDTGSQSILKADIVLNDELFDMDLNPDVVALEMIASYGMPVGKTVFETCLWIGKYHFFYQRVKEIKKVKLVYRAEVKMHLCHSMKAKDSNIRQAVIDRLGAPGTKRSPGKTYGISKDMWSALAIALFVNDTNAGNLNETHSA
jgi:hypothetical protein